MKSTHPVLIGDRWIASSAAQTFLAIDPSTGGPLPTAFPISSWDEISAALDCAVTAARELRCRPASDAAAFLEVYAAGIEQDVAQLAATAAQETGLPVKPRLAEIELPRTIKQLRDAARAARDGGWALPTIDSQLNIRSMHGPVGPVVVFGPNNFPFAYNGICGGDFAAAVAAGNPVIAKSHPLQPNTTAALAKLALRAAQATQMPVGLVQLLFGISNPDGLRMVGDPRVGAVGFTGSRQGGLALKAAADRAGKPIFLEMSSINPVVLLPAALETATAGIAEQFTASCLMAAGQFCTNPGLVLMVRSDAASRFIADVSARFAAATPATMLWRGGVEALVAGVKTLCDAGAKILVGGKAVAPPRCAFEPTLLQCDGRAFMRDPINLQREAFGNASLMVICDDLPQLEAVVGWLEGNLTGSIYHSAGDDVIYGQIADALRTRVGRLLSNKMPTGVAVTPAMNHGGPYPASGHAGFTAVGAPATLRRFSQLWCYDNVPHDRLPALLANANPTGTWRLVDGQWTTKDIPE